MKTASELLEQEKQLVEAKASAIARLLEERNQLEEHYDTTKKLIAADLKALGHHRMYRQKPEDEKGGV